MNLVANDVNKIILNLTLSGKIDAYEMQQLGGIFDDVIKNDNHPHIEIDFSAVQFLDSAGINALIYLHQRLVQEQRMMKIENVHGQPLMVMNLLHMSQTMKINSACHEYL